jgi:putative DNA primase/helicase
VSKIVKMNRQPKSAKDIPIHDFSEERLALDFVNQHQHEVRFIGDLNDWSIYDGTCWRRDRRRRIFDWSREVCRVAGAAALGNTRTEQFARALTSAKSRYAVTSLTSDDQRISMLSSEFDADPMLLGTPCGVVDLRTGILRESRPEDFITKQTAVAPAPAGTFAEEWQRFLETTFPWRDHSGPDQELIAFFQRWSGYCLTGLTTEQKFLDEYGTGRNGKNAKTDQWFGIMGDYAVRLPSEVLMQRPVEPHRAELMPLRGARLIIANEIP